MREAVWHLPGGTLSLSKEAGAGSSSTSFFSSRQVWGIRPRLHRYSQGEEAKYQEPFGNNNNKLYILIIIILILIILLFLLFRAGPMPYGSSQARGQIRATAAGLHHSHSNEESEPHWQPTPQLTATLD